MFLQDDTVVVNVKICIWFWEGDIKVCVKMTAVYAVGPGYNDIGLYDTSYIASNILPYQLIPHCEP